jgi:hypothetical protein
VKRTTVLIALFLAFFSQIQAEGNFNQSINRADTLPHAFLLGQYDGAPFEAFKAEYETQLTVVCKNDMELTYYVWVQLLKKIESHAAKTNFDMAGVKLWLYAFWNKDGSLRSLAFHPKPTSRNFKAEDMKAFLESFVPTYHLNITADRNFQHYSVGNFPVMMEKMDKSNDKTSGGKD